MKPSPRIERWKLRLMAYNFKFRPVNGNIADSLSRHCQSIPDSGPSFDEESERIVELMPSDTYPMALSTEEITTATRNYMELQELIQWLPCPPKQWPKTLARYK